MSACQSILCILAAHSHALLLLYQAVERALDLQAASQRPAFLPLVRSHVRGVRYGISRQVQHYLERLSDLSGKNTLTTPSKNNLITSDGLFKWTQTYCEAWISRFSVRFVKFESVAQHTRQCSTSAASSQLALRHRGACTGVIILLSCAGGGS